VPLNKDFYDTSDNICLVTYMGKIHIILGKEKRNRMRTALKGCELVHYVDIAVVDSDEEIIGYISNRLKKIENDKCKFIIDSKNSGGETSVICGIDNPKNSSNSGNCTGYNALTANIAVILADYIVRKYEKKLVNRIINTNYCYFNAVEKRKIPYSSRESPSASSLEVTTPIYSGWSIRNPLRRYVRMDQITGKLVR